MKKYLVTDAIKDKDLKGSCRFLFRISEFPILAWGKQSALQWDSLEKLKEDVDLDKDLYYGYNYAEWDLETNLVRIVD